MSKELHISIFDMVSGIAKAMDLVSPSVANHHKQVAYIAYNLASELKLNKKELNDVFLAGLLHDSGALSLKDRLNALQFEDVDSFQEHSEAGYLLFKDFAPFSNVASIIRYHHLAWNAGKGSEFKGRRVPVASHILHLADRIAVLIKPKEEILNQVKPILEIIGKNTGKVFVPHLVAVFEKLAKKEHFWLDTISPPTNALIHNSRMGLYRLDLSELIKIAELFCQIIDFRSRFTATHSHGVAATAQSLAKLAGFSDEDALLMKTAGYLHDLGKLAVPIEILEKPAKLTSSEYNIVKSHTYHTYRILETIYELHIINMWSAFHHERLDGRGYPFHHEEKDLPLGSQIMAVADVFTALTEERPYREGLAENKVLTILEQMVKDNALNSRIVSLLKDNYAALNAVRTGAQAAAAVKYQAFRNPAPR